MQTAGHDTAAVTALPMYRNHPAFTAFRPPRPAPPEDVIYFIGQDPDVREQIQM